MITHIYRQKGPHCKSYALAYAIQDKFGIIPSGLQVGGYESASLSFYNRAVPRGINSIEYFDYLQDHPFCKVQLGDKKKLYTKKIRAKTHKLPMMDIKEAIASGDQLLFQIELPERGLRNSLDDDGVFIPGKMRELSGHFVYCLGLGEEFGRTKSKYLKFANSWGDDFGDRGFFYVKVTDLPKLVQSIYKIDLYKL